MNFACLQKPLFLLVIALVLAGCQRTVATDVSEKDATEIAVALRAQGIPSTKTLTDSKKWAISVETADWGDATSTMLGAGLPRAEIQGYGELMKKDSMISSPATEKAKLLWAASNELSRSLLDIDGIISARVHLVVPDKDPFREKPRASSASVLIKHSAEIKPAELENAIRSFVSRSAEGLTPEAVSITFVAGKSVMVNRAASATSARQSSIVGSILAAAAIASLGLLVWIFMKRSKTAGASLAQFSRSAKSKARGGSESK